MTRLTDEEVKALIDGCEGAPQGKRYLGAQNDALYLITGRSPSPDNDHPTHNAERTPLAKVYDEAEGKRLAQLDPATIRSVASEVLESREAMHGLSVTTDTITDVANQVLESRKRIAEIKAALADPNGVQANMLSGRIAKPTWQQIKHLYPVEIAELEAALAKAKETADSEFTAKLRYRDERMAAEAEVKRLREAVAGVLPPSHGIYGGPLVQMIARYEDGTDETSARHKGTISHEAVARARAALGREG
jgi:hypothetical protein